MSRYIVLGGSGFVGRYVVSQLAARGDTVFVPTRQRERAKHLIVLPTVHVIEANIHDENQLRNLFLGANAVINLVGILNARRADDFSRVHGELARKVVAACEATKVTRLLHMSALHAAADAPSQYLRSKAEGEKAVTRSSVAWTVFQPSVIFGREDRFLNTFARLLRWFPILALASPHARFQPVFVGDVADAIVHCTGDDDTIGKRFQLCGPVIYSLRELVAYVAKQIGHDRPIINLGTGLSALQAMVLEHLPGKLLTRDNIASMQVASVCDCPFPSELGIEPHSLELIAPGYLGSDASYDRYAQYRHQVHR